MQQMSADMTTEKKIKMRKWVSEGKKKNSLEEISLIYYDKLQARKNPGVIVNVHIQNTHIFQWLEANVKYQYGTKIFFVPPTWTSPCWEISSVLHSLIHCYKTFVYLAQCRAQSITLCLMSLS